MNITLTINFCLILKIALFLTTACDENESVLNLRWYLHR